MENLNAEQIRYKMSEKQIKTALECCRTYKETDCDECPYRNKGGIVDDFYIGCCNKLCEDALSLIKELTEENERLRGFNSAKCEDCAGCTSLKCDCANIEAYAVEKYKSAIIEYYSKPKYQPTKEHPIKHTQIEYLFAVLDQIAKEMLEEQNEHEK